VGFASAVADMEGRRSGRHLLVVSAAMKAHEDMSDRTVWSSSATNELLTAARRAALEDARARGLVKSTRVGNRYEVGRVGVSFCLGKQKTVKLSCLLQDLFFTIHHEHSSMSLS
jgi:hypothetical protein